MRKLILAASVMALLCSGASVYATVTNFTAVKRDFTAPPHPDRGFSTAKSGSVSEMVRNAAIREGVPVNFALAVAEHESHFRCSAIGGAGERGVMQIKPATARGIGYKGTARGLNDCHTGIYWGMKYLRMAITEAGGDLKMAAFLYNAGLNAKTRNPDRKRYVLSVFSRKSLTK